MRLRTVGLIATGGAVVVLLVSLVAGIGRGGGGAVARAGDPEAAAEARVRVQVLNAAGIAGLARAATLELRDRGFDVVEYGNTRAFGPDSSLVLDRVGVPEHAEAIAAALGIGRVESRPDTSLYVEATVVLGADWRGAAGETAPAGPLADP